MAGKPAAEILSRISNDDPLALYPLCAARNRARQFLLDPDRVFERTLAEVSVGIELDSEGCGEPEWLLDRVDTAIQSTLDRDRTAEGEGIPCEHPEEHFRFFLEYFYVEPPLARLASVRYNALDRRIRLGFLKLIVEGLPLEQVLAMGLGPPERLQLDIVRLAEGLVHRRERGLWSPSPVARRTVANIRKHASERSAIICDAFS